jgi:hypothetical protein
MLPTAERHASQAQAAQHEAKHDAAHMSGFLSQMCSLGNPRETSKRGNWGISERDRERSRSEACFLGRLILLPCSSRSSFQKENTKILKLHGEESDLSIGRYWALAACRIFKFGTIWPYRLVLSSPVSICDRGTTGFIFSHCVHVPFNYIFFSEK